MNYRQIRHLSREALQEWLPAYQWDYFVTLHPQRAIGEDALARLLGVFIKKIDDMNYGLNRTKKRRLNWFVFMHRSDDGWLHAHLLVGGGWTKLDPTRLKHLFADTWGRLHGARHPSWAPLAQKEPESPQIGRYEQIAGRVVPDGRRHTSWFESVYELGGALGYMTRNYMLDDLQWDIERCNVFHKSAMNFEAYK